MNLIILFINGIATFLIVNVALIAGNPQDANYWIGSVLAFISGFGLRLMGDIRNKKMTWLNSFVQFVTSICLCLATFVFKDSFAKWMKLEYFIFFSALSSVYIIDVIQKSFKVGFLNYVTLLQNGLGKVVAENNKPKEEGEES